MFQWAGFGRIGGLELNASGGRIVVYGSFECEIGEDKEQPYGATVKGIIAGVFSTVFGKTFHAEEVECVAKGDPRCLFEVRVED